MFKHNHTATFLKSQELEKNLNFFEFLSERKIFYVESLIKIIKTLNRKIIPISLEPSGDETGVKEIPKCQWKFNYDVEKVIKLMNSWKKIKLPTNGLGFGLLLDQSFTGIKIHNISTFCSVIKKPVEVFLEKIKKSCFSILQFSNYFYICIPYFFIFPLENRTLKRKLGIEIHTKDSFFVLPHISADLFGNVCKLLHFSKNFELSDELGFLTDLILTNSGTKLRKNYLFVKKNVDFEKILNTFSEKIEAPNENYSTALYRCPFHRDIPGPGGIFYKNSNLFLDFHTREIYDILSFYQKIKTFNENVNFEEVSPEAATAEQTSKILRKQDELNYYIPVKDDFGYVMLANEKNFGLYSYVVKKLAPDLKIEILKEQIFTCVVKNNLKIMIDPFTKEKYYELSYLYREAGKIEEEKIFFQQPEVVINRFKNRFLIKFRESSEAFIILFNQLISNAIKIQSSPKSGFFWENGTLKSVNLQPSEVSVKDLSQALDILDTYVREFCSSYKDKAVKALKWFLCAPFSFALRSCGKRFPFLCLCGTTGTGKTTLALALQNIFGSYVTPEEIPGSSADTPARFSKHLENSSFPVVMSEVSGLFQKVEIIELLKSTADLTSPRAVYSIESPGTFVKHFALSPVCFTLNELKITDLALLNRMIICKFHLSESFTLQHPRKRSAFLEFYPNLAKLHFIFDYVLNKFAEFEPTFLKLFHEKKPIEELIFETGTEVLEKLFKEARREVPRWVYLGSTNYEFAQEILKNKKEEIVYVLKKEINKQVKTWSVEEVLKCLKKNKILFLGFAERTGKVHVLSSFLKVLKENGVTVNDLKELAEILKGKNARFCSLPNTNFCRKFKTVCLELQDFIKILFPESFETFDKKPGGEEEKAYTVAVKSILADDPRKAMLVEVELAEEELNSGKNLISKYLLADDFVIKQKLRNLLKKKCSVVLKKYFYIKNIITEK